MTVTLARSCVCGAVLAFEGARRDEREAKDKWEAAHGGCEEADRLISEMVHAEQDEAERLAVDRWVNTPDPNPEPVAVRSGKKRGE